MKTDTQKESILRLQKKADEAAKIALFYGFLPVEAPTISKEDINLVKDLNQEFEPSQKAAMLREFLELRGIAIPQPLMMFHEKPFKGSSERKKANKTECELVIIGSQRSVCEAILIQACRAIFENSGWKDLYVKVNSVGSKESVAEYERKMSGYIRKRMADFPPELRQLVKKDLYFLAKTKDEKYKEWSESAPQSVDYLSESSRIHLKEVLEFLETVGLPYVMEPSLMGDSRFSTETIFEIMGTCNGVEEVLAHGMRWNRLSRKIEMKREIPAVSVSISCKALKAQKIIPLKIVKPKFYLVQFGPEAKQKSFLVLEKLRKAGIPVSHSLAKDKLTGQISSVEQGGIPYMILMGQKEAIDNVVVIRNTSTRAQYMVPIEELGEFIKKSSDFK